MAPRAYCRRVCSFTPRWVRNQSQKSVTRTGTARISGTGSVEQIHTPDEVLVEKLHSETRVIADLCSLEMRASATAKMTIKRTDRVGIDVGQDAAFPLNEAAEMSGSSNVSNGAGRGVSVSFEVIGKTHRCVVH